MAKFIRIHEDDGIEPEEMIINLESITMIDPEAHHIHFTDCNQVTIPRQNEWQKLMSFVKSNEV